MCKNTWAKKITVENAGELRPSRYMTLIPGPWEVEASGSFELKR